MSFLRETFLWILLLPYALGFLGAASNQLVFVANHGKFPVQYNETWLSVKDVTTGGMTDDRHCVMTPETHLNLLADVFNFGSRILSIGDLLIDASDGALPYCWGFWLCLVVTHFNRPKVYWAGTNIPRDVPYAGEQHQLQAMQSSIGRAQDLSLRLFPH